MMKVKNFILFATFLIGQIPSMFFGLKHRFNLSVFVERSTRVDFFALYYSNAINFFILAYCLHFHKGIDSRISRFILIITSLDLIHLALFASKGFGFSKIGIALVIYYITFLKKWLN